MRRLSFAFLAFILLGSSQVAGQQIRKGGWGPGLGPFRILDTWHATFGGDARRVFSKYGMTLGSNGAGVRLVSHPVVGPGIMPRPAPPRIRNLPPQGSQADLPLVIDFRFPVRGLAFVFFGDPKGTTATVSGFNAEGVFLGKLEYDVSYFAGTDVEMEALAPEGISKLVVKFEGHQTEEEIGGEWAVKFVDPPLFTTVLPQIGDGLLDDGRSLSTRFTILNLSNTRSTGEVRFYDPLGNPLAVAVGSPVAGLTQASQFPLALLANQSLTFGTTGESQPVLSGYAVINSTEPLQVTAHFRTLLGARILTEVSAGSSAPRYTAKGSIERYGGWEDNLPGGQQTTHINTGLAIVNLSDQAARIRISVTDQPAPANFQAVIFQLVLPAHGQYARFISEIFTALAAQFQGVVSISSDQPLGVTLIRTGDGIPLSMLPLGSLEEE